MHSFITDQTRSSAAEFVQLEALLATGRQQLLRGPERVWHGRRGPSRLGAAEVGGTRDEAAAHGVELVAMHHAAARVERREAHAVGVQRQRLVAVEQQVERLVELDLMRAGQPQPARGADARERGLDRFRLDPVRTVALEPEQHRAVRAVPAPGQRQRAVQLHADPRGALEQPPPRQVCDERAGGIHRPHGVRTRRAEADLEDVEDGEGHAQDADGDGRWG